MVIVNFNAPQHSKNMSLLPSLPHYGIQLPTVASPQGTLVALTGPIGPNHALPW